MTGRQGAGPALCPSWRYLLGVTWRLLKPVLEACRAEPSFAERNKRALLHKSAEIAGLGVSHDLAWVSDSLQIAGYDLVERRAFRAGDLDDAVCRLRECHIGDDGGNIVRRDRLEQAGRNPHLIAFRTGSGDAAKKLQELGRTNDSVGDARGLDQFLLGDLGAEVAVVGCPVSSDDGKTNMVTDPGLGLRRQEVAARSFEEFQHRLVFERGRIGEVDHHLRARHRLRETLASDDVHARTRRGSDDLMARLTQTRDDLGPDQAGAADEHTS